MALQKELMEVDTFLEIYSISKSRFYSEAKKYPWLITKLGNRTYVKRTNAEKWLNQAGITESTSSEHPPLAASSKNSPGLPA